MTQCLELLKIQESNNVPLYGGATTATGSRVTPGSETHEKDERVIPVDLCAFLNWGLYIGYPSFHP